MTDASPIFNGLYMENLGGHRKKNVLSVNTEILLIMMASVLIPILILRRSSMYTWSKVKTFFLPVLLGMVLATGTFFLVGTSPATALTIIREYIPPGEPFEFNGLQVKAGKPPMNTVGGGNLVETFNAAADSWERVIQDDHIVTIQFGWSSIPLGGGVHNVRVQRGTPNRVIKAIVYFDNDGSTVWFLDPTPDEHGEFSTVVECYTDLGGGRLNSGRILSGEIGSAQALDFLTIAKHEIGHSLGFSAWNYEWVSKNADQGIHVNPPRPFPGSVIPVDTEAHLGLHGALMDRSLLPGQRKLISVVDLMAIAEMGEFIDLNINPEEFVRSTSLAGNKKGNLPCNPHP
jgi:hypothetical protein